MIESLRGVDMSKDELKETVEKQAQRIKSLEALLPVVGKEIDRLEEENRKLKEKLEASGN